MPDEIENVNLRKKGTVLALLGFGLWLTIILLTPPRIPSGDLICFKDPGINFARGEGLVERLSPAHHSLTPQFYSNYPPLAPYLYGFYVKVAGVSAKADEVFDFLTSSLAGLMFWFYIAPRFCSKRDSIACLCLLGLLLLLLPIGPFWTQRERPDSLSFAVMLGSLMIFRGPLSEKRIFLTMLVAGVNGLISPFGFVMNCGVIMAMVMVKTLPKYQAKEISISRILRLAAAAVAGVVIPLVGLFVIQWLNDPSAISRFATNASGKSTNGTAGAGYFAALLKGDFHHYLSAFKRYNSIRYQWMMCHLVFVALLALVYFLRRRKSGATDLRWLCVLAIACAAFFPPLIFPYQPCYTSFTAAIIAILFVGLVFETERRLPISAITTVLIGTLFLSLVALPFTLREFAIGYAVQPTSLRINQFISQLRKETGDSPLTVASTAASYFDFKRTGFIVTDMSSVLTDEHVSQIDLFAFTSNATPFHAPPDIPAWIYEKNFELIHAQEIDSPVKIGHLPVYNRRSSWDVVVYRRRK
ncbi:MAG: hypothetical protein ABIT76_11095 [Chthoniobacterales bacterium]